MTVSLNLSESEKVAKIERFEFDKAPTLAEKIERQGNIAIAQVQKFAEAMTKGKP